MKPTVLERIKNKQFLLTGEPDTRTDGIEYRFNSLGYRTKEFNDIDWTNSIVVFGGSDVLGEGIDEQNTITSKIQAKTGLFAVNMGVGGASIQRSLNDSLLVAINYPAPKAIVNIWAVHYRITKYTENKIINYGPWNWDEPDNYLKLYVDEEGTNAVTNALFVHMASKQIWKDTKRFDGSFFKPIARILDITTFDYLDKCKDGVHPGSISMEAAAETIIKNIL